MNSIKLTRHNINIVISKAIAVLNQGGIIAYPTETFYGLGVKFDMQNSLEKLYEVKKRPIGKAMPVIIGDYGLLPEITSNAWLANIPMQAKLLMDKFWPGPLTLLMPAKQSLSEYLTADTGMIAVRLPGESFALQLAKKTGYPITATSANISGMPPAKDAATVRGYFATGIDLLIDGGIAPGGLPSTIIDMSEGRVRIVREGAIKFSHLFRE